MTNSGLSKRLLKDFGLIKDFMFLCVVCQNARVPMPYARAGSVTLVTCGACGTVQQQPRPDPRSLVGIHDNESYFHHPYFEKRRYNHTRWHARARAVADFLDSYSRVPWHGMRHLDIGADAGGMLLAFQSLYATRPTGLEISAVAVAAMEMNGIIAFHGFLEDYSPSLPFELVTAMDVVEHVADPCAFFKAVQRCLAPNGIFYFETPNLNSTVYRVGRFLCHLRLPPLAAAMQRLFPPEHVEHYTPEALRHVALQAGIDSHSKCNSLEF